MPVLFSRSMSALDADGARLSLTTIVVSALLLALWSGWFFLSRVAVHEISQQARLEVNVAAHAIHATVSGRVVAHHLALNREVRANQVLVEIDSEVFRRRMDEQQARGATLAVQSAVLRAELLTEEKAARDEVEVGRAAMEQARARLREALAAEDFAAQKSERMGRAFGQRLISEIEYLETKADLAKQRAAADGQREELRRLEKDEQKKASERKARVERVQREAARLDGDRAVALTEARRLEAEADKLKIRAPVAGRIAEVGNLRVGSVVSEGQNLAAIVPLGVMQAVAYFPPSAALGRIRVGQSGRLRLAGYPWTQYGALPLRVESVASEIRDGLVRVGLTLGDQLPSAIPIQHGLPGAVEVEVEIISPARLFLRAAGKLLAAPVSASSEKASS